MRTVFISGTRGGILEKAQTPTKRERLEPQAFLRRIGCACGIGKLVLTLDGGGCGDPDAQQQDKKRGAKPHLSQPAPEPRPAHQSYRRSDLLK